MCLFFVVYDNINKLPLNIIALNVASLISIYPLNLFCFTVHWAIFISASTCWILFIESAYFDEQYKLAFSRLGHSVLQSFIFLSILLCRCMWCCSIIIKKMKWAIFALKLQRCCWLFFSDVCGFVLCLLGRHFVATNFLSFLIW